MRGTITQEYVVINVERAGPRGETVHLDLMQEGRHEVRGRLLNLAEYAQHRHASNSPHATEPPFWAIMQWIGQDVPPLGSRLTVTITAPEGE